MKYFISNHKRLTLGIILYIAVFIVSSYISPWQIRDVTLSDLEITESNIVMNKIPINIIYFGIYELCELLIYANSAYETSGLMFFITACAIFSYTYFIRKYFIIDEYIDELPERLALDFIYDNIFAYIISLLIYYFYTPVAGKINHWLTSDVFILRAVIIVALILFIIIPSIPQLFNLLAYIFSVMMITMLLNYIDESLDWNIILKALIIVLTASILLIVVNIFINILLERLQEMLLNFLSATFPVLIALGIWLVKFCIKAVITLAVIAFIVWAITFMMNKFA
ncbi:MAG: hypothetical protein K2G63_00035 [Oscillospiraceae bacterium]|nr:hypothetical protein [Oscillospiraceae bacterium]